MKYAKCKKCGHQQVRMQVHYTKCSKDSASKTSDKFKLTMDIEILPRMSPMLRHRSPELIGGRPSNCTDCQVSDLNVLILLGTDILEIQLPFLFDMEKNGVLSAPDATSTPLHRSNVSNVNVVFSVSSIAIQPRSEVVIQGRLGHSRVGMDARQE